ncbi:ferrous iron transporter B [Sansalvadorimonas verongulae]|uniref:ferrous iron transporter B n=1 Tax=Sansalvadorimonas verongulae TaxID=2172824 RepID=UPI0012BC964F|nr:ferrous iron transporter B [Sansalvadorimonas verongulae]MTI14648.1 ferrous iron transporter B [Sansalvadorimonas verongulae]
MAGVLSLSPLREELDSTVESIVHRLGTFSEDRNKTALLQEASREIDQVYGVVQMMELSGAELLVNELVHLCHNIQQGNGGQDNTDDNLETLGKGLFIFQRYIDFILTRNDELPEILLPAINHMRKQRGVAVLPESQFFSMTPSHAIGNESQVDMAGKPLCTDPERSRYTTRRLRQMYQVGLLGMLSHKRPYAGMRLMQRSCSHLSALHSHLPFSRFCTVVSACLEAFVDMEMELTRPRRILFSRVDQLLRKLQLPAGLESLEVADQFLKEMLYLIAVSGSCGQQSNQVLEQFSILPLPFSEKSLQEARNAMAGPASEVLESLSHALTDELSAVKDMLDLAERGANSTDLDYTGLAASMSTLSKTLGVVGLHSAASTLQKQQAQVQLWQEQEASVERLHEVADSVLYVEAMVSSLSQLSAIVTVSEEKVPKMSVLDGQLGEARLVVLDEAMSGLTLTKRAINAYLESGYDKIHLDNLPKILQAVRGGMQFSGEERGAQLMQCCADFIRDKVLQNEERPANSVLETFADVLSSLEYFIESGSSDGAYGDQALELAEASLLELGYNVAAA